MYKRLWTILYAILLCSAVCGAQPAPAAQSVTVSDLLGTPLALELEQCGIDQKEFDRLMRLDLDAFDQDFEGGWRAISQKEDCATAAAEIIKAYLAYSYPQAPESIRILRWHAGQVLAGGGHYPQAIAFFRASYNDPEKSQEWNLYVDASIAFLKNDREALQTAYETLAAFEVPEAIKQAKRKFLEDNPQITMPPGFVEQPQNLSVVAKLLSCFGRSYKDAYGGDGCE